MRAKGHSDALAASVRRNILKAAYQLFSQRGIEAVTIPEVAEACGMSRASVFRYFPSKLDLVVAVSVWSWEEYNRAAAAELPKPSAEDSTAAELLDHYMEHFLILYRNHRAVLRYNQFFNLYILGELHQEEKLQPYVEYIQFPKNQIHAIYEKAQQDGTLRTDLSESFLYSAVSHIMQGAANRFAAGPVFERTEGGDPEAELRLLKRALLRELSSQPKA